MQSICLFCVARAYRIKPRVFALGQKSLGSSPRKKRPKPQSDSELRVQIPVRVTNKKSVTRSVALFLLQKLYRLSLRDPNPSPFVLF
jgi:hypothetical protein